MRVVNLNGPFIAWEFVGTTDGTTNRQELTASNSNGLDVNQAGSLSRCEPDARARAGRLPLDVFSDLVVFPIRAGLSYSLPCSLEFELGRNNVYTAVGGVLAVSSAVPFFYVRNAVPPSALRASGLTVDDALLGRLFVTPGIGLALPIGAHVLLVPGVAAGTGRGNQFSGPVYDGGQR